MRYDPRREANDVAGEGEHCRYCGEMLRTGEPVVRAAVKTWGRFGARHAYACAEHETS